MVPAAHLLGCKGGDEPTSLVEELVALTASVAKLRWPALARCKSQALLTAADVMDNCHRMMKFVDVTIANRVACCERAEQRNARCELKNSAHRPNEK